MIQYGGLMCPPHHDSSHIDECAQEQFLMKLFRGSGCQDHSATQPTKPTFISNDKQGKAQSANSAAADSSGIQIMQIMKAKSFGGGDYGRNALAKKHRIYLFFLKNQGSWIMTCQTAFNSICSFLHTTFGGCCVELQSALIWSSSLAPFSMISHQFGKKNKKNKHTQHFI